MIDKFDVVEFVTVMGACGAQEGWLVIFDRRPERAWDERISWHTVESDGCAIHVVGA